MKQKQIKQADTQIADTIVLAALPELVFESWSLAVLQKAAAACGYTQDQLSSVFPAGVRDAVIHFSHMADLAMLETMQAQDLDNLRIRERVALGVRSRLEFLTPHKDSWRQTVAWLTLPRQTFLASRLVWRTADKIWWTSGDTATDYNHYTKRGLLSAVLGSTTLYWFSDTSPEHADSWAFLERRIDNVLKIGQKLGRKRA